MLFHETAFFLNKKKPLNFFHVIHLSQCLMSIFRDAIFGYLEKIMALRGHKCPAMTHVDQ